MERTEIRTFHFDRTRYHYDLRLLSQGWEQYETDQDFSHFGVWVHIENRQVLTFAEGDETLTTCTTLQAFKTELASMAEFYGEAPPSFTVFDIENETATITRVFDPRPEVKS